MATDLGDLEAELSSNALAFLRRAIAQINLAGSDSQQLTFAVVDIAVAIEILLKARLVREHWSLILAEVDRADKATLLSGRAKTVTPDQAIKRLVGVASLPLVTSDKKSDDRATQVQRLLDLRNRAAHFTLAGEDCVGIRAQLGVGLHLALWLLDTEFRDVNETGDPAVQEMVTELIGDVAGEIGKVAELVDVRLRELEDELETAQVCVKCPRCAQPTLMLGPEVGVARCPFCLSLEADGTSVATEYVEISLNLSSYDVIKDGGEWPIHPCPDCGESSLVDGIVQLRPDPAHLNPKGTSPCDWIQPYHWACFACGLIATEGELERCYRCGILGPHPICLDCSAELFGSD